MVIIILEDYVLVSQKSGEFVICVISTFFLIALNHFELEMFSVFHENQFILKTKDYIPSNMKFWEKEYGERSVACELWPCNVTNYYVFISKSYYRNEENVQIQMLHDRFNSPFIKMYFLQCVCI